MKPPELRPVNSSRELVWCTIAHEGDVAKTSEEPYVHWYESEEQAQTAARVILAQAQRGGWYAVVYVCRCNRIGEVSP